MDEPWYFRYFHKIQYWWRGGTVKSLVTQNIELNEFLFSTNFAKVGLRALVHYVGEWGWWSSIYFQYLHKGRNDGVGVLFNPVQRLPYCYPLLLFVYMLESEVNVIVFGGSFGVRPNRILDLQDHADWCSWVKPTWRLWFESLHTSGASTKFSNGGVGVLQNP